MAGRTQRRRSKRDASKKHVRVHWWEIDSGAYRSLSAYAKALYVELKYRHDGQNNGYIPMAAREAGERVGCTKNTACKAFGELQAKGFIECMQKGAFSVKDRQASEWRLTCETCERTGQGATKDFRRWQPGTGLNNGITRRTERSL